MFVPADAQRFIPKAATRGADIIVLDLEDGVAASAKDKARDALAHSVQALHAHEATVYVRVNNEPALLAGDLDAALASGADGIVLPKIEAADELKRLDKRVGEAALPHEIGYIGIIETAIGVCNAPEIARASARLRGLCFGPEDYALAMGVEPVYESLAWSASAVAVAAVAAGVQPLGLLGSVADFTDIEAYREVAARSQRLGMRGATCIHPAQVAILNEVFSPSEAEVKHATELLAAFDAALAEGKGAISLNGKMVDEPIAQRARLLLARHRARQKHKTQGT